MASVQRGTATIANNTISTTATLGTAVDSSQSFIRAEIRVVSDKPDHAGVTAFFTSTGASVTGLTFERGTTEATACVIEWQVIEHTSLTVEHGSTTMTSADSASKNVTITAVTLNETFPLITHKFVGDTFDSSAEWDNALTIPTLTATTTLNLATDSAPSAGSTATIHYQIVSWSGATVQAKTLTFGTGDTTITAAINAVVLANSFIVGYTQLPPASERGQYIGNFKFNSTTEVQGARGQTDSEAGLAQVFVVELDSSAVIQSDAIGDINDPTAVTVTAVADVDLTFTVLSAGEEGGAGGGMDRRFVTSELTTTTNVDTRVTDTGDSALLGELFTIELPSEVSVPDTYIVCSSVNPDVLDFFVEGTKIGTVTSA